MKLTFRIFVLLIVAPLTYYLIGWAALLLVPGDREHWITNIVSLIWALGAGWYVWSRTGYGPTKLVSRISYGAFILGGVGFLAGILGPGIFSPGASQGPLLGIFITGPLGFLLGGIGGFAYWWIRDKRNEEDVPLSWKSAFGLLPVIGVLFFAIGLPEYLPVASCLFEEAPPSIDKQQLRGLGHLYFVPLGDFSKSAAQQLAQYYHSKYGVEIVVLSHIRLPEKAFNAQRKQYESDFLLGFLRSELKPLLSNSESVVIALTDQDIYIASHNWRYAFSYRSAPFAVVSSARMDRGFLGLWKASERQLERRFRKMITKNIGLLYFNLPQSDHCRSVMYKSIGGPQELDFMREDY
jgi:predicted Zn-dependent protease